MSEQIRRRPGGRSAKIRSDVAASTLALLAEGGYADLTLDAVAKRAGVHRSTLYRRWGTVSAVVLDALLTRSDEVVAVPDTGTFDGDLRLLLAEVRDNLTSAVGGAATIAVVAERSPEADDAARRFWDDRTARMAVVVQRAVERGEVAATDARAVVEMAVAPLFFRLLVSRTPIDDALLAHVANTVGRGLQPG